MTLRSAVWTGSNGSAWPALSNGDAWATGFWSSPAPDAAQIAVAASATVDGSSHGTISATHNLSPQIAASGGVYTTTASTAGRYTFAGTYQPTTTNTINLVFVTTTWTASHYHQIVSASCTGSWAGLTYDKITDYVYNIAGVYYCLSVFRTVASATTTGSIVVDVYDTSTGLIVATQATGGTCQTFSVWGVDQTSNGANAIRTANTTTANGSTNQPAVTLTNNLLRYSSLPVMFCSHGQNTAMTSGSADSAFLSSGSYGTPANGVAAVSRLVPATSATVKTQRTMTANFTSATTAWGAIGLEILDKDTSDTYTDRTRDYTYVRIANNTNQPAYQSSEVRTSWNGTDGTYGPYHGLIGRYVVSGGTKYWIGASLRLDSAKGYGNAYIYSAVDTGTSTTVTQVAFTTGVANPMSTINMAAMRVRVLSNDDLWVSAKWWVNGNAEPAWPSNSGDPSVYNGTPISAVVNGTYATNDALRNATTGQTGLYYLYPAATNTGYSSGAWYSPADGAQATSWTTWTNDAWVESTTGSSTGTGSLSSSATKVVTASAALTMSSTLTSVAAAVVITTASDSATGSLSASGTRVLSSTTSLAGSGSIDGAATPVVVTTSSVTASASLLASPLVVKATTSALAGDSSLTSSATRVVLAGASASGTGTLAATGSVEIRAALSGTGALVATAAAIAFATATSTGTGSLGAEALTYRALPTQVRITSTAKVGTGTVTTTKVGTGTAHTLKVGTGLTHTQIKEVI